MGLFTYIQTTLGDNHMTTYYIQLNPNYIEYNTPRLHSPNPRSINLLLLEYRTILTDYAQHLQVELEEQIPNTKFIAPPQIKVLVKDHKQNPYKDQTANLRNYHWYPKEHYPPHLMEILIASIKEIQQKVAKDPLMEILF